MAQDSDCSNEGSEGDGDSWQYTSDIVVSMFAGARTGYLDVRSEEEKVLALPSEFSTPRKVRRWL
jgi:hypothetical protein